VVPVKRVGDMYYRELQLASRTLAELKLQIAHEFGVPEDDIAMLLRDEQVLLTRDVQVSALNQSTRITFALQVDGPIELPSAAAAATTTTTSRPNDAVSSNANTPHAVALTSGDSDYLEDV